MNKVAIMSEALKVPTAAGCPDWTRHNENRLGHLTPREVYALAEMIGDDYTVRQVLSGKRVIKVVLKNPTRGNVLGGLLEEVGDLIEAPGIESFDVHANFSIGGELPIVSVCGLPDIVEWDILPAVLKKRKLLKRAVDVRVVATLGDENPAKIEKSRIAFAHVFEFLKTANIHENLNFYVDVDAYDSVLSINTWYDLGLHIEGLPIPYPRELEPGDIVVSS